MRLLLAEDEKALSKALTAILVRNHYAVDQVYDGQAALDYLQADNYDGVILDIMMPKLDGISVLKELRRRGNLQRLSHQAFPLPGVAGPHPGHDQGTSCSVKLHAAIWKCDVGSGHF